MWCMMYGGDYQYVMYDDKQSSTLNLPYNTMWWYQSDTSPWTVDEA